MPPSHKVLAAAAAAAAASLYPATRLSHLPRLMTMMQCPLRAMWFCGVLEGCCTHKYTLVVLHARIMHIIIIIQEKINVVFSPK